MTSRMAVDSGPAWASRQSNDDKGGGLRMRGSKHIIGVLTGALVATMGAAGLGAAPASAAIHTVAFRGSTSATATVATQRVVVPATVQAGDGMLLFATTSTVVTVTVAPDGWTLVGTRLSSSDTRTNLYKKVAAAGDAGTNEAITYSAATKGALNLLAYSGTAPDPVEAFASAGEIANRTAHTTPGATVPSDGSMVVSFWADKSSATTGWTLPAGQTQRALAVGTGSGRITSVASDSGAPQAAGPSPARIATASAASAKATMWTVVLKAGEDPNIAPVASFTTDCPELTCTVNGAASSDADGTVSSYAWNWGDGTTGDGVTATHTYATAGQKTISLVVTDNGGKASTSVSQVVTVTAPPPTELQDIVFRAAASSALTNATQRVTIPAAVRADDGLLLFASTASLVTPTTPAGWTLVGSRQSSTDTRTYLYSKAAVTADAGNSQTVVFSASTKGVLTVLAYSGTAANPIESFASAAESTSRTTHTTPGGTVPIAGEWVVSYWADRSTTTAWTLPAGQTSRTSAFGIGPSHASAVASDFGGPQVVGATPARTATANVASAKATMWTVVLKRGVVAPPDPNAPVAFFTANCPELTCTVDGSGSTDADGTIASYAWDFGDGVTGDGVTATHTYATAGQKTISLVVTDNDLKMSTVFSRTVTVTAPPPTELEDIAFRASASFTTTSATQRVDIPNTVQAGDGMLLFATTAVLVTPTTPAGWTLVGSRQSSTDTRTYLFSKAASVDDGGTTQTVVFSGTTKGAMTLVAYSGTAANPIESFASAAETTTRTTHTTPGGTVPVAGEWVVSYWADKSTATTAWTLPAGQSLRTTGIGTGPGHITAVASDFGGPQLVGATPGRTATANAGSAKATMWTVVLKAAPAN